MKADRDWYRPIEVARLLEVDPATVHHMMVDGRLPFTYAPGGRPVRPGYSPRRRIPKDAVHALLEGTATPATWTLGAGS